MDENADELDFDDDDDDIPDIGSNRIFRCTYIEIFIF